MHLSSLNTSSIVRFSEPSMMEFYGGIAEFTVQRIRHLEHQHFQMIHAFVNHPLNNSSLLLLNRLTQGEAEDGDILAIFQCDHDGSVVDIGNEHLTADREHFASTLKANYPGDGDTPFTVTYSRLASEEFHGIEDKDKKGPYLSQALYETQDDANFYLALVEWERDWLTAWFGMELRKDQVTFI